MYRLIIELTNRCNLNCIWCGAKAGQNQTLSFEDVIYAIDKYKPVLVSLTGGEPLLRKDIFEIIDYCKSKRKFVELCTNGILISKEAAEKLNADVINISVDGLKEINDKIRGQGAFEKIVQGIENLKEAGKNKKIVLATVLGKANKSEPKKIIKYFYPAVKWFMFGRLVPIGRAKPEMCLNWKDALKVWASLQKLRLNPFLHIIFAVQFWQMPGPAIMGPVILANGKIARCCVKYNKIIGNIKTTKRLWGTNCLFCSGCSKHR
jgi:MoaA/NifB/PqqE/SkfB family radical SAM enzyme